jgi:hypothetical protein
LIIVLYRLFFNFLSFFIRELYMDPFASNGTDTSTLGFNDITPNPLDTMNEPIVVDEHVVAMVEPVQQSLISESNPAEPVQSNGQTTTEYTNEVDTLGDELVARVTGELPTYVQQIVDRFLSEKQLDQNMRDTGINAYNGQIGSVQVDLSVPTFGSAAVPIAEGSAPVASTTEQTGSARANYYKAKYMKYKTKYIHQMH